MKGIILAGGSGTRLQPITNIISKQVIPVYDKPMVCYPLSVLMNFGIDEILIISTPRDLPVIENLLGDGSQLGIKLTYIIQDKPEGIAQAFILGKDFIGSDSVCLILGDNIFYGTDISEHNLSKNIREALRVKDGAYVLAYQVKDPERYGVVKLDKDDPNKAVSIVEKPKIPESNYAVTGLYFYDNSVIKIAEALKPSARGELEITDVNNEYLKQGKLNVIRMGRGFAWLDAGTPESLLDAALFVQTVEKRQGIKIACLEEIAYLQGFINREQFEVLCKKYSSSNEYGQYLKRVLNEMP